MSTFKSGFVNIIGRPNVGKSTLMNGLIGEQLSIMTYKPQTTRHRIHGILTTPEYQIVFSDTPGFIENPNYGLHQKMNHFVKGTFEDADIMLLLTSPEEEYEADHFLIQRLQRLELPIFLVMNKMDLFEDHVVKSAVKQWRKKVDFDHVLTISALERINLDQLLDTIVKHLPEGPQYYPEDQLSDRNVRFFVTEMIREQILLQYREEIPYSVEVVIEEYTEEEDLVRIHALIFVNRKTQKGILIGKGAQAIKALGIAARQRIEQFVGQKVHLQLFVKVRENWRDNDKYLNRLGYQ